MERRPFKLHAPYAPAGDQPQAVASLARGLQESQAHQVLLGVTGSGKTFTMANVIAEHQQPALVLAHNKTLAAQLYQELKSFFPDNAVEYFVSYYDYYQPEAYVPSTDTYIEKDSMINEAIDRLRHSATRSLLTRRDVIIVASVSCIYGIGSSESYEEMTAWAQVGDKIGRDPFLRQLVEGQYVRNDISFSRGTFRVRGDVVEVFPAHEDDTALRIEFFGDEVERITVIDPLRGQVLRDTTHIRIWPASHYAIGKEKRLRALKTIREELLERLQYLRDNDLLLEAQRLEQRTLYDLEMLEVAGSCKGIENYSRHLTGRQAGDAPPTLLDYFPRDFLIFIDESHQTVPQVRAMYRGDRARKQTLVDYGFRLPSALDNRPLMFEEFQEHQHQTIYVSATPNEFELDESDGVVVEQLVRPTGLLDPEVEVRPATHQVDDVIHEVQKRIARDEKVLITTLTKRMSEDLTDYLLDVQIKARYLHSDIDTLERVALLRALRAGEFDVLVGINLLREGLDLPEVTLVAILDADKEGFLRSATGLIQTIGRAARNASGKAILYGDRITKSMQEALDETTRRREIQEAHNQKHGITPQTIAKEIRDMPAELGETEVTPGPGGKGKRKKSKGKGPHGFRSAKDIQQEIKDLRDKMFEAAGALAFEEAAQLRDEAKALEELLLMPEFR